MPRNGADLYSKLAGSIAVPNTVVQSTPYNAQIDDVVNALNDVAMLSGSKPMTGLQLLSGAGTSALHGATVGQVQQGRSNWADGGGTADAITASYTPAVTAVADGDEFYVRATAANATTTPTFTPNNGVLTARTITKNGNVALAAGDIAGDNHELHLRYRSADTKYELLNPKGTSYSVNGQTEETSVAPGDFIGGYDISGTAERKFTIQNTLKVINALTEDTSPDAANDFVITYDASAGDVKKVKPSNLSGGTSDYQAFTASGTWTKPAGYPTEAAVLIQCWGAGGGGKNTGQGGGGGGGCYTERWVSLSQLGATVTVTVGAGGAGGVGSADGSAGGNTTFGAHVTAYGGAGGNSTFNGGGGGGLTGAGSAAVGGPPTYAQNTHGGGAGTGVYPSSTKMSVLGGGGGGLGNQGSPGSQGGDSIWGGGGGAGNTNVTATGGTSVYSGAGGNSPATGAGGNGSIPGGGGGASASGGAGNGARGECRITVFG
jgi:hypothetical protein